MTDTQVPVEAVIDLIPAEQDQAPEAPVVDAPVVTEPTDTTETEPDTEVAAEVPVAARCHTCGQQGFINEQGNHQCGVCGVLLDPDYVLPEPPDASSNLVGFNVPWT